MKEDNNDVDYIILIMWEGIKGSLVARASLVLESHSLYVSSGQPYIEQPPYVLNIHPPSP